MIKDVSKTPRVINLISSQLEELHSETFVDSEIKVEKAKISKNCSFKELLKYLEQLIDAKILDYSCSLFSLMISN